MKEYARTEFGIYKVIGKYERNRGNNLCVQLGDFYTGEFKGEEYESNLKLGNLIDLIEVKDIVVMLDTKFNTKDYIFIDDNEMLKAVKKDLKDRCKLLEILTHEQFEANCYKISTKQQT